MRIVKLGENLFEVRLPFWYWTPKGHLGRALLEIQAYGKTITSIHYCSGWKTSYLVATM